MSTNIFYGPEEREVIISRTMAEDVWSVYCSDSIAAKFWRRLSIKTGGSEEQMPGNGIRFRIPATQLVFSAKKKMNLSNEERQRRRERLQQSFVKGGTKS